MTRIESPVEVRRSIDIAVPPAHAFTVFATGFDTWWNRGHHLLPGELKEVIVEPFVGGRMQEISVDGDSCVWGRVLSWEPDREFAFSWLIGSDWKVPGPDAVGSRVTVTFSPTETGTHVELVHDQFEADATEWSEIRRTISGDGGWTSLIQLYAEVAAR